MFSQRNNPYCELLQNCKDNNKDYNRTIQCGLPYQFDII